MSIEAKVAPYYGTLQNNFFDLHACTPSYEFFQGGQATRFTQTGIITKVKFYAQNINLVTDFRINIWSKNESTGLYTQTSSTGNLISLISNGLNILDLSSLSISANEGDSFSIYILGTWDVSRPVLAVTLSDASYHASMHWAVNPATTNFNWTAADCYNGSISIEFYMEAPDAVFIGDSIISGHVNSFACTTQVSGASYCYPLKVLPAKVQAITHWTYQNMGVTGDKFPAIYNRFAADVIAKNPKYAIIEGGVNNLSDHDLEPAQIFAFIQQLIIDCQAAGIIPIIILIPPAYGHVIPGSQNLKADTTNNLIIAYKNLNPNFIIVDARSALGTYDPTNGWSITHSLCCDPGPTEYIHPNEAGHTVLAGVISASLPFPGSNFSFYHTNNGNRIQFQNNSSGIPTSYLWDFGDGETSTEISPIHTYASAGTYTITLTASNISGSDISQKTINISGVFVSFSGAPISCYEAGDIGYDIQKKELRLYSGLIHASISPIAPSFPRTFLCYTTDHTEIEDLEALIGTFGTLTIDGVSFTNCYISSFGNIKELILGQGKYSYSIGFSRAGAI